MLDHTIETARACGLLVSGSRGHAINESVRKDRTSRGRRKPRHAHRTSDTSRRTAVASDASQGDRVVLYTTVDTLGTEIGQFSALLTVLRCDCGVLAVYAYAARCRRNVRVRLRSGFIRFYYKSQPKSRASSYMGLRGPFV